MLGFQSLEWIEWNLLLAAIPAVAGYLIAAGIERWTLRKRIVPWAVWVLPILTWLAFLPNTCYLLTEWRHFLFDSHFAAIRDDAADNPFAMLTAARQSLFFVAYSAVGALCFALSIRPMHHVLRKAKFNVLLWAIPFFLLVSVGTYMGLIVRLNSWDLVKHTAYVFRVFVHALSTPKLAEAIVIFAGLLWLLYIIIDMWVDGFMMRIKGVRHVAK
jgi:uncharacterized membrane protein